MTKERRGGASCKKPLPKPHPKNLQKRCDTIIKKSNKDCDKLLLGGLWVKAVGADVLDGPHEERVVLSGNCVHSLAQKTVVRAAWCYGVSRTSPPTTETVTPIYNDLYYRQEVLYESSSIFIFLLKFSKKCDRIK